MLRGIISKGPTWGLITPPLEKNRVIFTAETRERKEKQKKKHELALKKQILTQRKG
jgi:hypothetical protein